MNQACEKINPVDISMDYAKIKGKDGSFFRVESSIGVVKAKRAINCLIEPEQGDLVLMSVDTFGRGYIISVLEREAVQKVSIVFDQDVDLMVNNGRLRAIAQNGVDMVSGKDVSIASPELSINSFRGEVNIQVLTYFGRLFNGYLSKVKLVAQTCDSTFENIVQKVKRSYRYVAEFEQLKAGQLKYRIKKLMSFRGKYTVLTAEDNVKIDGKQILMG